jgi:hypothetical protein
VHSFEEEEDDDGETFDVCSSCYVYKPPAWYGNERAVVINADFIPYLSSASSFNKMPKSSANGQHASLVIQLAKQLAIGHAADDNIDCIF